jgi:SNF2 family DNA or RNA helicase
MEGWGIFRVLVPDLFKMSYNNFMLYYCITRMQRIPRSNRQIPVVVGYYPEKIKEFREAIDAFFIGRPKHLVASELPSLTMQHLEVEMSSEQEDKYAEALEGLLALGDTNNADVKEVTKLTALIYCQEIVNDLQLINCDGGSPKLDALIDLLTEGDLAEDKVIVFSRFEKMISIIMNRLAKEGIKAVRVTGTDKDADRDTAKENFQKPDSDVRVLCITTAGSEALNLQAAKALVCYDTPWSAGDFLQLVGRMVRIGSKHDRCYVIHLLSRGHRRKDTIDSRVMDVLKNKMQLVEAVLGKRIKGEGDAPAIINVENEISDLFESLKQDAREAKAI